MVDPDILNAKASVIVRCLDRIHEKAGGNIDLLEEPDIQDIVVLNLQRAIQGTLDIAAHCLASAGTPIPPRVRDYFDQLESMAIISGELRSTLQSMVGFRNIAVHDYLSINQDILRAVVENRLDDFQRFLIDVYRFYSMEGPS